ncbi:unnamed protein product [Camellia sinensis]
MKPGNSDGGATAPLLPKLQPPPEDPSSSGGASISGAVFNVSTSMIGAGIMSIPATFKVLGVIPGFVLILIVAFLVEITVEFLLRYTNSSESISYGGLMAESFGKFGSIALQVCVMVTNLGALIIYLIIIGGMCCVGINLKEHCIWGFCKSGLASSGGIRAHVRSLSSCSSLCESLKHASAVSILLAVLFVAICSAMALHAMWEGKTQRPRLVPDFANGVSVFDLFTTIPVFATGFGCHVNVHPVRAELSRPSDMSSAVRISLLLCIIIYFAVGFFGYLLFGDSIMSDMLVNFDQNSQTAIGSLLNDVVRVSYAIHLMMVFPVMNFSLRANVDELFFPRKPVLARDTPRFVSLTCVLLTVIYLVAIAIPNIWYFFQFMGTTTVMFLMFIFPSAIILRDVHGISTRRDKITAVVVIVLAVGTSLIAIASNVYSSISKK